MPPVQPKTRDASMELELTGARRKKPATREQIRQQVRSRSNSRGWLTQARRASRGTHHSTDDITPNRPRAESVGFVDTLIGEGPATTLTSPHPFSEAGAVGGTVMELTMPPPLDQQ